MFSCVLFGNYMQSLFGNPVWTACLESCLEDRQTDRPTDRQTDRPTDRQTDFLKLLVGA